jgi:DNA-binding GntR family transcriptional regulator
MPIKQQHTLSDVIFHKIKEDIITGNIKQGAKIIEQNLAQSFNTSRGPLREALQKLENINLIERKPHSKTQVITLNFELMRDIYQMRELLEGFAARLAATNMTQKDIDNLYRLLDKHSQIIKKNAHTSYLQQEGDLDFHYYIFAKCGNKMLINYLEHKLYQIIRMCRQRTSNMQQRVDTALNEHYLIVDAIYNRDGEFAEILMRRHISGAWRSLEKLLRKE